MNKNVIINLLTIKFNGNILSYQFFNINHAECLKNDFGGERSTMTVPMQKLRNLSQFQNLTADEHDSCGILAIIEKDGIPKRTNMIDAIDALIKMEHRSGFINGEGDGCGILTDIPRDVWSEQLSSQGVSSELAFDPHFAVAHIFLPNHGSEETVDTMKNNIRNILLDHRLEILCELVDSVNHHVLGPNAKKDEPHFWQIACLAKNTTNFERTLFDCVIEIEKNYPVHVCSFSNHTVVYKLMGAASLLPKYFHDLNHPRFKTLVTIGHNRYSTNTLSNFYRVQPFSLLGHNGEINTIQKLRDEAAMIGVTLADDSSDSQDVNRVIETLIHHYGFTLFEALELLFPPIIHEIKHLPEHLRDLYMYYRQTWGPFAQGPAGIVSRYGDECVFRVDALGLRPLWFFETERSLFFASEQGIVSAYDMIREPKPLAPGESIGVKLLPKAKVFLHHEFQQEVYQRSTKRFDISGYRRFISTPVGTKNFDQKTTPVTKGAYAAFGWDREQIQMVEEMASKGADPIRSLGHDAPLASLAKIRQNIADYIKESVAVVTNPAIDREREIEHFSTRVVIGERPKLNRSSTVGPRVELPSPVLVEQEAADQVYTEFSTLSYEELLEIYSGQIATLSLSYPKDAKIKAHLQKIAEQAVQEVQSGKTILLLDDQHTHQNDQLYLDPHLVVAKVHQQLMKTKGTEGFSLRRNASIILRSGAIRNLHDLILAFGLGADAISPYLMFKTIANKENQTASNLFDALRKGLEKIISTIGIHEIRGYSRLFSAIGLHPELAEILGIVNYCGSKQAGLDWETLHHDAEARYQDFSNPKAREARLFHLWPRVWKSIGKVASGESDYEEFAKKMEQLETQNPTSIRHVFDLKFPSEQTIQPNDVDLSVGNHDLPLVISSMSFGSQGEVAFRAYAEAADRLNMVSLNGEGGEIKDMLGKYPNTRGHQIASGRFGVNIELVNSANLLEIKIGQGAKPGEGGHLPGKKVSEKVAAARNATPGSDLISPSNNHDIYSIEDLAQVITECKTANKKAKVIVKVPVVPNIGTIAVGIAKAGADIISLSGFDGGTGAARIHSLQHVGLPIEIGVKAAHLALIEAGIRDQVEIWADGGLKSSLDVIKLMLLGANRIGFATLAMIAIGCTSCRGCHLDTCHVGIATQIESIAEAKQHGLKRFVPREFDLAVENLMRLFSAFGEELRVLTAKLGFKRTQDLVGRSDLLFQARELNRLDTSDLLKLPTEDQKRTSTSTPAEAPWVAVGAQTTPVAKKDATTQRLTQIHSKHRVLFSDLSGARVRNRLDGSYHSLPKTNYEVTEGSIPGNGLAAYHADGIEVRVVGGAQDGVGKTAFGGRLSVLKSLNKNHIYINGSVGKSFCYGAQRGLFIVQGNADSRAGIRLSGADLIIGGQIKESLQDHLGMIASRANIKGFAFEYMTDGRALVLGDPGPWICSGMTGGVVYLRLQPEVGLDEQAIERRIAKAAKISLEPLSQQGLKDVTELLTYYRKELIHVGQLDELQVIEHLLQDPTKHFLQVIPTKQQADSSISTE